MQKTEKKEERFSARLDDMTTFALDLLARQEGKKKTAIVETSIRKRAEEVITKELGVQWTVLFHPHEGVRTMNVIACPGYNATPHELDIRAFAHAHREFFFADPRMLVPQQSYVMALWDHLQHYMELWRDKRGDNYWVAADAMAAALRKAKIKPPKYGQDK